MLILHLSNSKYRSYNFEQRADKEANITVMLHNQTAMSVSMLTKARGTDKSNAEPSIVVRSYDPLSKEIHLKLVFTQERR